MNKRNTIQTIPIDKLIAHPNNPNRMSQKTFTKLVRNIEQTGMYEPIIVRPLPVARDSCFNSHVLGDERQATSYEIINGHHRVKALKQLGYTTVDVCIWDVDDRQTNILLTTLNRLSGTDILEKKLALLRQLNSDVKARELSKILPLTSGQIDRLCHLKLPKRPARPDPSSFTHPLVFFVTNKQKKIIDNALHEVQARSSKKQPKAAAITHIAEIFLKSNNSAPENTKE